MGSIVNKCNTKDALSLKEIEMFAIDVKNRESHDIERLKKSIIANGFLFPLFIWKGHNMILDGKSRYLALNQLASEGQVIDEVPVVFVSAENETEAKEKVLQVNSRYGKITEGSLNFFAKDCEINLSDLNIHLDKINFSFDSKQDLIKKGQSLVIGGAAPQTPPLNIGGTQPTAESLSAVNGESFERVVTDSNMPDDGVPQFENAFQDPVFDEEEQEPPAFNEPLADAEPAWNANENKASFTCPFCYAQFELSYAEVQEILAQ